VTFVKSNEETGTWLFRSHFPCIGTSNNKLREMINAKQKNEKINEEERSFTSLCGDFRNPNTRVCGGEEA
jgi:hypothetical protein